MRTAACVYEDQLTADHQLFEQELACCRRQLYPAALKLTGNPGDAEDLLQETLTRAYAARPDYPPGSNASAWLYRIMSNAFVSVCRKRKREAALGQDSRDRAPCVQSAEDEVLGQFAHSQLLDAIQELPECFKATVYLCDILGYSYRDVAEVTGAPIGTVMSRLHRARGRLREQLAAQVTPSAAAESVTVCQQADRIRSAVRVTPQPDAAQPTSSESPVNAAHIVA